MEMGRSLGVGTGWGAGCEEGVQMTGRGVYVGEERGAARTG